MAMGNFIELRRFLIGVQDIGVGHLRKQEFLFLHGRRRLTSSIWMETHDLWLDVEPEAPLFVGEAEGCWAFAYGEGLTGTDNSWFKDVRRRAQLLIE